MPRRLFYFALLVSLLLISASKPYHPTLSHIAPTIDSSKVNRLTPPVYGFYSKVLYSNGIPIRASKKVSDQAMLVAASYVKTMLQYAPVIRQNMIRHDAEIHIYGRDEVLSDTPEYADIADSTVMYNGKQVTFSQRYHGYTRLFSTCDETNLLELSNDDHHGYSICSHEFAHLVMGFGLDDAIRAKIKAQYQQAMAGGLWKGSYAATNEREYWAELCTWYFGSSWTFLGPDKAIQSGRKNLEAYDPEGYKLVNLVYTGQIEPAHLITTPAVRIASNAPVVADRRQAKFFIFNDTHHQLKLFWISHTGAPKSYGTVLPFRDFYQPTSYSDLWYLEDETGKQIQYFRPTGAFCEIKVSTLYNPVPVDNSTVAITQPIKSISARAPAAPIDSSKVTVTQPLVYGFYGKVLYANGIAIRASKKTDDKALLAAAATMKTMLQYAPEVNKNMVQYGGEIHIFAKNEGISSTPEYADKKGTTVIDDGKVMDFDIRYTGMTGLFCLAGEANLLALSNNDHHGYSTCTHEFAHYIMRLGLDNAIRAKIKAQYQKSLAYGLWKGSYAATNENEYWAEVSSWYFGSQWRFLGPDQGYQHGRESLEAYDPGGYNLAYLIYTGQMVPAPVTVAPVQLSVTKPALDMDGRQARLFVFNDSPHKLKMYWISPTGEARAYDTVMPYNSITQPTSYGDAWYLEDEYGIKLKYMSANAPLCEIKVSALYN